MSTPIACRRPCCAEPVVNNSLLHQMDAKPWNLPSSRWEAVSSHALSAVSARRHAQLRRVWLWHWYSHVSLDLRAALQAAGTCPLLEVTPPAWLSI